VLDWSHEWRAAGRLPAKFVRSSGDRMGRRILWWRGFHDRLLPEQEESLPTSWSVRPAKRTRRGCPRGPPTFSECDARAREDRRSQRLRDLFVENPSARGNASRNRASLAIF